MRGLPRLLVLAVLLLSGLCGAAQAHEVRPGYLELRQVDTETWDLLWKVPANGDRRLALYVQLPENCHNGESGTRFINGAYIERWRTRCSGGLTGQEIGIAGLPATRTDVLVRVALLDGRTMQMIARPSKPWVEIAASQSGWQVAVTYTFEGIRHILFGADHLLFVLGLLLIVKDGWMLVKTITAFTLAHSITLAVATLGYASAPALPLNAAIALSILFLGPEIVRSWRGETSFTIRHPWVVAFAFGLLHGFGFATALTSAGLPRADLPAALLSFNVGVELGQLGFVALILAMARSFRVLEIAWPRWVQALPGYTVGALGAFWTLQRVALLVGALR
jgi:HupE / UreJ protein